MMEYNLDQSNGKKRLKNGSHILTTFAHMREFTISERMRDLSTA